MPVIELSSYVSLPSCQALALQPHVGNNRLVFKECTVSLETPGCTVPFLQGPGVAHLADSISA
jgi:hypothetical protein